MGGGDYGGAEARGRAVILVPFPAQGHVTPMLHLARALARRGFAPTLALPDFFHGAAAPPLDPAVALAPLATGPPRGGGGEGFAGLVAAMEARAPAQLERLLLRRRGAGAGAGEEVACVVVDVLASWAVPIAARCGVPAAGFWPAMLASYRIVSAIPELLRKGFISDCGTPLQELHLPFLPKATAGDLPWLVGNSTSRKLRFAFWRRTLRRAQTLPHILVNSFDDAEPGSRDLPELTTSPPGPRILPIGPLTAHDEARPNYGLYQPDPTCVDWLDSKPAGSVIYVSFGSWVGPIGPDRVDALARGLDSTGRPFLWALKPEPAWRTGLPARFEERVAGRGKLVGWAPQEEVLGHPSVGCYLTHCGWNSTVEALKCAKRLLCYPISGDQFVNCEYIEGVWGIGLRVDTMDLGELRGCVEKVMGGREGEEMQRRVDELRREVLQGKTSVRAKNNLQLFVDSIKRTPRVQE
ncbi:UDP-glycosyltransferase 82A1 [Ananas comosus]|uniref:Glycosyltransferase n=1 Tax=Ananas comosus TaxID=4615 RepID=A0A199VNY7_ANACO|nr:UDP-glycosyltransferase 82A1 [Ananas comosus]